MSRPTKEGLSYFPLDVDFMNDPKIIKLQFYFGPIGVYTYIYILCLIYKNGYYLEMSCQELAEKVWMDFKGKKQFVQLDTITNVIRLCVQYNLFDIGLFQQNVISSISVQKQWLMSTKRRHNSKVDKYSLLSGFKDCAEMETSCFTPKNMVNVCNNSVNVCNNSVNVNINSQSKSKSKMINIDKKDKMFGYPNFNYFTNVLIQNNIISEFDTQIAEYDEFLGELACRYNKKMILAAIHYFKEQLKIRDDIVDQFAYFKKSIQFGINRLERKEEMANMSVEEILGFKEEEN